MSEKIISKDLHSKKISENCLDTSAKENIHAQKIKELQKELEVSCLKNIKFEEKYKKYRDQALRAFAEVENIRKRTSIDLEKSHKFSIAKFANSLLPIIDSLEKTLELSSKKSEISVIHDGIKLTMKIFIDIMNKFGISQINPIGECFSPNFHEAMSIIKNPKYESNTVVKVYQIGYILHGRLLRPARVVVNK